MSEVYVFFATGFEEIEGLTCVDLMRRADIDVTTVSVTGEHTVVGSHKIPVQMDKLFDEVDFGQAKMLCFLEEDRERRIWRRLSR